MAKTPFQLPMRETELTRAVVDYLRALGFIAWRQNVGGSKFTRGDGKEQFVQFGFRGLSDVLCVLPDGKFLAVETKVPGNGPTAAQSAFLADVNATGALGILAYSLDDVTEVLRKRGYVR